MDFPTETLLLGSLAIAAVVGVLIAFAARARPIEGKPSAAAEAGPGGIDQPVESAAEPTPRAAPVEMDQRGESAVAPEPRAAPVKERRAGQRERLAAAFAEQIEDVLRAFLLADPLLAERDVDLGTAADGSLEIVVDGEVYSEVSDIPDQRIREALAKAVADWQTGKP